MHLGTLVNLLSHVTFIVLFMHLLFLNCICPSVESRTLRGPRALSYIANQTVCMVDKIIYKDGDPIPTDDPCESCKCRPPGFSCVLRECEVKPGCKAIRREGECCPEYQCGCEHNGRFFNDGDRIPYAESPCYTCYCQGSSITCALADCKFRFDCEPEYITGECCPRYDHCPPEPTPLTTSSSSSTTAIPITTTTTAAAITTTWTTNGPGDVGNSSNVIINESTINGIINETVVDGTTTPTSLLGSVTTENVINESSSVVNNTPSNTNNNSSLTEDVAALEVIAPGGSPIVSKDQVNPNLLATNSTSATVNNNKGESTYLTTPPTTTPTTSSSSSSSTSSSSSSQSQSPSSSSSSNVQVGESGEGVKNVLTAVDSVEKNGNSLKPMVPLTSTTESLKVTTTNLTFQTLEINDSSSTAAASTVASTSTISTLAHEQQITDHQQVPNKNLPGAVEEETSTSTNYPKESTTIEFIPGPFVESTSPSPSGGGGETSSSSLAIVTTSDSIEIAPVALGHQSMDESINEPKILGSKSGNNSLPITGHIITESSDSTAQPAESTFQSSPQSPSSSSSSTQSSPWSPPSPVLSPETSDETTTLPSPVVVKVKELVKGQSQHSPGEMPITSTSSSSFDDDSSSSVFSSSSSSSGAAGASLTSSPAPPPVSTSSSLSLGVTSVVTVENSQPTMSMIWSKDATTTSFPNSFISSATSLVNSSAPPPESSSSPSSSSVLDSNSDADVSTGVTTQLSSIHSTISSIITSSSSNIITEPGAKLETATVVNVNLVSDEVTTDYPTTKTWIPDTSLIKEHREASTVNSQSQGQPPALASASTPSASLGATGTTISPNFLPDDTDIESIKLIPTTTTTTTESTSFDVVNNNFVISSPISPSASPVSSVETTSTTHPGVNSVNFESTSRSPIEVTSPKNSNSDEEVKLITDSIASPEQTASLTTLSPINNVLNLI